VVAFLLRRQLWRAPLGIIKQYARQQKTPLERALYPRPKAPGLYGPGGKTDQRQSGTLASLAGSTEA